MARTRGMVRGLVYPYPAREAYEAGGELDFELKRDNKALTTMDVRYAQARAALGELYPPKTD